MSISVDQNKNRINISLNKSFYAVDAVKKAAEDFKEIGDFSVHDKKNILVSIKVKDASQVEILGYEFCNYVLFCHYEKRGFSIMAKKKAFKIVNYRFKKINDKYFISTDNGSCSLLDEKDFDLLKSEKPSGKLYDSLED